MSPRSISLWFALTSCAPRRLSRASSSRHDPDPSRPHGSGSRAPALQEAQNGPLPELENHGAAVAELMKASSQHRRSNQLTEPRRFCGFAPRRCPKGGRNRDVVTSCELHLKPHEDEPRLSAARSSPYARMAAVLAAAPPALEPCDEMATLLGRALSRKLWAIERYCDVGECAALDTEAAEMARAPCVSRFRVDRPLDRHTAAPAEGPFGLLGYHEAAHGAPPTLKP